MAKGICFLYMNDHRPKISVSTTCYYINIQAILYLYSSLSSSTGRFGDKPMEINISTFHVLLLRHRQLFVLLLVQLQLLMMPNSCNSIFINGSAAASSKVQVDISALPFSSSSSSAFKMVLFADLHYGENGWTDWGPIQDINSDRVISNVLDQENPDFVVYLGDVITANNIATSNASLYWDQALSPTRARGIPWATIFGNHDDASFEWPIEWFSATGIPQLQCPQTSSSTSGLDCRQFKGTQRVELMKNELHRNKLSHSRHGPQNLWPSVSNYVLEISSEHPKEPVAFLYFLDSGGGSYPQVISSAQAKWFQQKSNEINPHSRVPELIFWHIPSKAYEKVAPKNTGIHKPCVGSINMEKVAGQEAEMGIMEILANRTSVKAVFVGHNHGLDWCCPCNKLWLCFARHSGYGGYGDWPRGSRVIEITRQPEFSIKSWIRMEDGEKHSEVVLSP